MVYWFIGDDYERTKTKISGKTGISQIEMAKIPDSYQHIFA